MLLRFTTFGGLMPSVSPRELPPENAQEHRNLHLRTNEFRPIASDAAVAVSTPGARTLYRFARNANGEFLTDPSSGWITSAQERSYVKGQINDQRTERTYYTVDDGSSRPRAIDVTGSDRLLGVPRPTAPVVEVITSDELTASEAQTFLYGAGADSIRAALADGLAVVEPGSRIDAAVLKSGPYSLNGLVLSSIDPKVLFGVVTAGRASTLELDSARLDVTAQGGSSYVPLAALPFVHVLLPTTAQKLRDILWPTGSGAKTGTRVLTDAQITKLLDTVTEVFDPSKRDKNGRDELDKLSKEFFDLLTNEPVANSLTRPTEPLRPTTVEFETDPDTGLTYRTAQWITYDQQRSAYTTALQNYNQSVSTNAKSTTAINTRLKEIQDRCKTIAQRMEADSTARYERLTEGTSEVADFLDSEGGVGKFADGFVERQIDDRRYGVTFTTDWGDESQMSPFTELLEVDQNDKVKLARPQTLSGETFAARHIVKWSIYRATKGTDLASFRLVEQLSVSVAEFIDDKKSEVLTDEAATLLWAEPPYRMDAQFDGLPKPTSGTSPHLRGLVGMPNGIMAGFIDNMVAFCHPYHPYAWPVQYQIKTEFPVVGLGVFGQTLFVGTTGNPYFISGSDSASMSAQKIDSRQACVSRRSIIGISGGVLYASPDGLCLADANGVRLVSGALFTRSDWQQLDPQAMHACVHEDIAYVFYTGTGGGCLTFDAATGRLGRVDLRATAAFTDTLTDTMYLVNGSSIFAAFSAAVMREGVWRSARIVLPQQTPLAWLKVYGEQTVANPVTVIWRGDDGVRHTTTVTSLAPVRLPAGRWLEHEFEFRSRSRFTRVCVASSTSELQSA